MDEETTNLILALQLEDLEHIRSNAKGKGRENDELPDADLAVQLQQEEYERANSLIVDRRFAQSIHRAVQDDGASIVILASEENNAAADHEMACRLSGRTPRASSPINMPMVDEITMAKLSNLNIEDDSDDDAAPSVDLSERGEAESSASTETWRAKRSHVIKKECVSCQEMKEVVEVSCKHLYCRDCIRHLFADAMVDETLFPPRCCRQHIPVSMVRHFLNSRLTTGFEQKAIEYGSLNRTYCCDPLCATFVDPSRINGPAGTCPKPGCGRQTCITCKREAHPGTCSRENPFEDTIRLAQESGWQRCQRCQNMVELGIGCNHIT